MADSTIALPENAIAADDDGVDAVEHSFPPIHALNERQREAVECLHGPLLVLAGAGTGKTRVLTTRLAYILHQRLVSPNRILGVTFTNKAAHELRERIQALAGHNLEGFWLGTFHSLCVRMLRRHAERIGYSPSFTIIDTSDQWRIFKQIIKSMDLDEKSYPPRLVGAYIDRWKNQVLSPQDVMDTVSFHREKEGVIAQIYQVYQERLTTLNCLDFGDLLLQTLRLFKECPDVLAWYQENFAYVLVDEYQDINTAQYLWLRLLAKRHKNICCVGDDDQSIYGWRGADIKNILRFEKDFPGAKVIRLEQNYRSTPHILAAASAVIERNDGRLGKSLWTEATHGELLTVATLWDAREEAAWIVDQIEATQSRGKQLRDMAVLVRAGFQTREIEERLIQVGVPYRVVGGLRFYERSEIRDALAYLRLLVNPADSLAFERIVNLPKRGVGPAAMAALHDIAKEQKVHLLEAARLAVQTMVLKGRTRLAVMELIHQLDTWRGQLATVDHAKLAELVLDESGYNAMLLGDKSEHTQGRRDNLKELVTAIAAYPTLGAFLEHVSLVMDSLVGIQQDVVTLMTLHSAKGLEFDIVFLAGWEEGIFPSQQSLRDKGQDGLEEERRLAYVGITRAKEKAYITNAKNRLVYGKNLTAEPSRFIAELPPATLDVVEHPYGRFGGSDPSYSSFHPTHGYDSPSHDDGGSTLVDVWDVTTEGTGTAPSTFRKSTAFLSHHQAGGSRRGAGKGGFGAGAKIYHQTYGRGIIMAVDQDRLDIYFPSTGTRRKILKRFVVLDGPDE